MKTNQTPIKQSGNTQSIQAELIIDEFTQKAMKVIFVEKKVKKN